MREKHHRIFRKTLSESVNELDGGKCDYYPLNCIFCRVSAIPQLKVVSTKGTKVSSQVSSGTYIDLLGNNLSCAQDDRAYIHNTANTHTSCIS